MYSDIVKRAIGGALPKGISGTMEGGPPMAMAQGSDGGKTKSDLQNMIKNELQQHQEAYGYANGHNDHGMGQ